MVVLPYETRETWQGEGGAEPNGQFSSQLQLFRCPSGDVERQKDKGVWIQETSELETQIRPSLTLGLVKAT